MWISRLCTARKQVWIPFCRRRGAAIEREDARRSRAWYRFSHWKGACTAHAGTECIRNAKRPEKICRSGISGAIETYFLFYRTLKGDKRLDDSKFCKGSSRIWKGSIFPFATAAERFRLIETPAVSRIHSPREMGNICLARCVQER